MTAAALIVHSLAQGLDPNVPQPPAAVVVPALGPLGTAAALPLLFVVYARLRRKASSFPDRWRKSS